MIWLILLASLILMNVYTYKALGEKTTGGPRLAFMAILTVWAVAWGLGLASQLAPFIVVPS